MIILSNKKIVLDNILTYLQNIHKEDKHRRIKSLRNYLYINNNFID